MNSLIKKLSGASLACGWLLLTASHSSWAVDISDKPLVGEYDPVPPNVMFMIDDSGSMRGTDQFYTPGYDFFGEDYTCDGDLPAASRNATVIDSSAGTVNARIWRDSDTAYFNIAGTDYVLADEPGTYTLQEAGVSYSCSSNTDDMQYCTGTYDVATRTCSGGSFTDSGSRSRDDYGFEYSLGGSSYTCFNNQRSVFIPDSEGVTLTASDCKAEADGSGSSITNCVFNASTTANGIEALEDNNNNLYYRPQNLTFSSSVQTETTAVKACFDPEQTYTVQLEANSCSGDYCYSTRSTDNYDGGFLNWYFSASSSDYYDTYDGGTYEPAGDLVKDLSGPDTNFDEGTGYKDNTNDNKKRMDVAKDVAHILAKGIDNMRVGIASFESSSSGGEINQELVELDDPETEISTDASYGNREDLHAAIDTLIDENWTPLGETWATLMDYFSYGIDDTTDLWTQATPERANSTTGETGAYTLYGRTCTGGSCSSSTHGVRVGVDGSFTRGEILEGLPSTPSEEPINATWWCRNNFIIGLTDGEPTQDARLRNALYYNESTKYGYFNGDLDYASDASNGADGLDDVAVFMYEQDMRPDIPRSDAKNRHNVVTYMIAFGTLAEDETRIMESAATYAGGKFYNAKSGADVAAAMVEILGELGGEDYGDAPTIISGGATELGGSLAFEPNYNNGNWTGSLEVYKVNQDTGNFLDAAGNDVDNSANAYMQYEISNELATDFAGANHVNRRIFTLDTAGKPIAFTAANKGSFATAIAKDIAAFTDTAFPGRTEDDLIDYLRGETTLEGTSTNSSGLYDYRDRGDNILGSIVHSSPIFVQSPPRPWPDSADFGNADYPDFQDDLEDRLPMIYVGANDGMLHAFRATDPTEVNTTYTNHGEELFAYIPTFIGSSTDGEGLHHYAEHDYDHYYYVDLTPTLSDVYMDFEFGGTGKVDPKWHTVLIGGAGKGGKGLFALNVTCPIDDVDGIVEMTGEKGADAATPDRCVSGSDEGLETYLDPSSADYDPSQLFLWEFSSADDANLGYTYSRPTVAKINYDRGLAKEPNGNGKGSVWAAIFGNGYNSTSGYSSLYILFLDGGLDGTWTMGTDYVRIDAETVGANGLSSPELIDIDGDLIIDYAYAGDLKGNVWRFTFDEKADKSNYATTMTAEKIFQAKDASGNNQPITTVVRVRRNPDVKAADPNLTVMFGTGKALGASDLTDTSVQTIYGIHDRGQTAGDNVLRANLAARTLADITFAGDDYRTITGTAVDYNTEYGWMIDLNSGTPEGERVIYDPVVIGGTFLVSSSIYDSELDCDGITDGWLYAFDWREGLSQVETENQPPFGDIDADGDGNLDYTGGKKTDSAGALSLGEGGKAYLNSGTTQMEDPPPISLTNAVRLSWEERFPSY